MSIGQVMIHVSTLETAKKFYVDILGLSIKSDLSSELGMWVLDNDGCFFTVHEGFSVNPTEWSSCKTAIILKVKDVKKSKEHLLRSGVELKGKIIETPVYSYQALKDFDGNWIEIAQFK